MAKYLFIFTLFIFTNAIAGSSFYLHELSSCTVALYENKEFKIVDSGAFVKVPLEVSKLSKNPEYVIFKHNNQVFLTHESCVMSVDKKKINNDLMGNESAKQLREKTEKEKFEANKYFIELDVGVMAISDESAVADYNDVFPSNSSTSPTAWGKSEESAYSTGPLLSLGFGVKSKKNRFLAFKLRMLSGKKSDAVDLIDLNTSISQKGAWAYEDTFKNFYVGYKFIFLNYFPWKPVLGVYLGASYMNSTLSDGDSFYQLSSLGPAALAEAGAEYQFDSHWALSGNLGFEYLGKRSMTFEDESSGTNFKSVMSYTNQYLIIGLKYYFR